MKKSRETGISEPATTAVQLSERAETPRSEPEYDSLRDVPRPIPREHSEYVINEEVRYDSLRDLIDNLSGLSQEEQRDFNNNAREQASRTRDYRFKIVKRMSDTDVRILSVTMILLRADQIRQENSRNSRNLEALRTASDQIPEPR